MKKQLALILLIFVNQINGQNKFSQIQQINEINKFISFISKKPMNPTLKDYANLLGNDFELEIDEIDKTCSKNCKRLFNGVKKHDYLQKSYLLERLVTENLFRLDFNNKENLKVLYLKTFHNVDLFEIKNGNKSLCYFVIPNESENKKIFITEIINLKFISFLSGNDVSFYFKDSRE